MLLMQGYFAQSIRSATTGREYAVFSRRVTDDDSVVVAAVETRLLSLMDPALPRGYGFAIIDGTGSVQFHHDPARNLRENIFDEIDAPSQLQEAVATKESRVVRTTYRTRPHVFFASPMDDKPWTILTFVDGRYAQQWGLSLVGYTITLYSAYLLFFALYLWLAYVLLRGTARPGEYRSVWYWPRNGMLPRYILVGLVAVSLLLVWTFVVCKTENWSGRLWLSVLIPFLAFAATEAMLRLGPPRLAWGRPRPLDDSDVIAPRPTTRLVYGGMSLLLVVVCGIIPAAGIFQFAHDHLAFRDLSVQQFDLAHSTIKNRHDLRHSYDNVPNGPSHSRRNRKRTPIGGKRTRRGLPVIGVEGSCWR